MKSRPILFQSDMVRALLNGSKTQTRRAVKMNHVDYIWGANGDRNDPRAWGFEADDGEYYTLKEDAKRGTIGIQCPYGVVGDTLWVRETFYCDHAYYPSLMPVEVTWREEGGEKIAIPEDEQRQDMRELTTYRADDEGGIIFEAGTAPWSSPIHMPKWLSRITLEITDIRAQRVQEISHEDACQEGWPVNDEKRAMAMVSGENSDDAVIEWYADLWESINGKGSWDLNPFVWAISFRVVKP